MTARILAAGRLSGTVTAPPSKSLAHRAVLCAALSKGLSLVHNLEQSRDIVVTLGAALQMGARVTLDGDTARMEGRGGFATLIKPVYCGESGSSLRFLIPLMSLTGQKVRFTGAGRLFARPMGVYQELFEKQNLEFVQTGEEIQIRGALHADRFVLPGNVSSQFISGLLFALPLMDRDSEIVITPPFESRSYVELTRSVQAEFGVCSSWSTEEPDTLRVPGGQYYRNCEYTVEGDYSQAAFFAVLGALCGGIAVDGLRENSSQGDAVILRILERCGAKFVRTGEQVSFEKSALTGCAIDLADCPDLGPILMVLGVFCQGDTVIYNAGRLRLKESDRIAAMTEELAKFGARIESDENTVTIHGGARLCMPGRLDAHNDHRVVMSLAVAALAAGLPAEIADAQAVEKSWPGFFEVLRSVGAKVETDDEEG